MAQNVAVIFVHNVVRKMGMKKSAQRAVRRLRATADFEGSVDMSLRLQQKKLGKVRLLKKSNLFLKVFGRL